MISVCVPLAWGLQLDGAPGNHGPDLDMVFIREHLVFGHEVVAANDEMGLNNQVQFLQHIFGSLGAFDLDRSRRMAQLYLHEAIISRWKRLGQGA